LYFAHNLGAPFRVPEEVFSGAPPPTDLASHKCKPIYAADVWADARLASRAPGELIELVHPSELLAIMPASFAPTRELAIMVGPQGSGKSTVTTKLTADHGFEIVSGDVHGAKAAQIKRFKALVAAGGNVVVDNTNAAHADRAAWRALAPGYNVTLFYISVAPPGDPDPRSKASKGRSFHCVRYRMHHGGAKIPTVAVHMYYKRLVIPTAAEGTVVHINGTLSSRTFDHNLRFVWK
jgi:predicted ABC-type ATPase